MFTLQMIVTIVIAHWVADFIFQTDKMAQNKSTDWLALCFHVAVYTGVMTAIMLCFASFVGFLVAPIAWWALGNGALHFCIDAVTSRIARHLWSSKMSHDFFVVIGLDQLLHTVCLFATAWWLLLV